jgi:anti-anti-sigma factor
MNRQADRTGAAQEWLTGPHSAMVHRSSQIERARTGAWIAVALARGHKVFYKHPPPGGPGGYGGGGIAAYLAELVGQGALDSGRVEPIDAADCHADTGGEPAALHDWHLALIDRALREGYAGVGITCDGAALRVIVPEPVAMLTHEHDLTELAGATNTTVLCRYDLRTEAPDALAALVQAHPSGLEDLHWAAARQQDRLVVAGEIDISNVDRFAAVLSAAVAAGIRTVDAQDLRFCAAAGLGALAHATQPIRDRGEKITLHRVSALIRRVLDISGLTGPEGPVLIR